MSESLLALPLGCVSSEGGAEVAEDLETYDLTGLLQEAMEDRPVLLAKAKGPRIPIWVRVRKAANG